MRDVARVARQQVVDRDDLVALGEKAVAEVAAEEPGAAGDETLMDESGSFRQGRPTPA